MVYKSTMLGIAAAVKVAKDRSKEEDAVDSASDFLRHEAEVYRSLSWRCPSVPVLITFGNLLMSPLDETGSPFLATTVVPGRPILQMAKARRLLDGFTAALSRARSAALAAFAALRELHDAGFAHNDISNPNNVSAIDHWL